MTKINYSCYWHNNKMGYREVRGYQPWNTPIRPPADKMVAKYHRLRDRLAIIEELLYDEGLYEISDYGERMFGGGYYYNYAKDSLTDYHLNLLSDYEEYGHKLSTYELDIKATLDDLIASMSSY